MKFLNDSCRVREMRSGKQKTILILKTIFHSVAFLHHLGTNIFGTITLVSVINSENEEIKFMARFSPGFGTLWNFSFQVLFLSLALIHDGLEWLDKSETNIGRKLSYWRDTVFNGLTVPYTWFVCYMFWTLWFIDRELVFPKVFDAFVPFWFNHCVHTNIMIILIAETILEPRRKPRDSRVEHYFFGIIAISYAIVFYSIYFATGKWLYKVFGVLTWWQICLYQSLIWGSSYFFYRIHFFINRIFHGRPEDNDTTPSVDQEDIKIEKVTKNIDSEGGKVPGDQKFVREDNSTVNNDQANISMKDTKDANAFVRSWSHNYRTDIKNDTRL